MDHCTTAKSALAAGDVGKARTEFNQYKDIREQAVKLDGKILTTTRRGMDSNLKYCERVENDIQVTEGRPVLEQGLSECDKAIASLKANKLDEAKQHYDQFTSQRDKALKMAPGLNNIFSLTSEIRRCERVESKMAHFGQQQAALAQTRDAVLEESEALHETCNAALKEVNAGSLSETSLRDGNAALSKILGHRKTADADYQAFSSLTDGRQTKDKKLIEASLAKSDKCIGQLRQTLGSRQAKLKAALAQLKGYADSLAQAERSCKGITGTSKSGITQARYRHARTTFESARDKRNSIQAELNRNTYYTNNDNSDWPQVRQINSNYARLNRCLDTAGKHLNGLLAALTPVAPPPTPTPAPVVKKKTPAPAAAAPTPAPAPSATGPAAPDVIATLQMTEGVPDAALLFWQDGTAPSENQDIRIFPTGFEKKVYVVNEKTDLVIRNTDFSRHEISASIDSTHFSNELARLGSHQMRVAHASWPTDTIATLHSQQARIAPSYMANIDSGTYVSGEFATGSKTLTLQLKNPNKALKGMLLLPNYDPLSFTLHKGQTLTLPITRDKVNVGQLVLKGGE